MADKKISELPLLNSLSGSSIIVPIVHDGTTSKLNIAQLGHYTSQWSAKTGSANTFSGNQTINGNLTVSGRLTVNEVVAVYETASVVFSSGSNVFGDALSDVHQFTGSVDIDGTLVLNGSAVGLAQINAFSASVNSQLAKVYNATASLEQFTSSQDNRNFVISQYTSSTDAHIVGIASFTSSQLAVNTGLASVSASFNSFTASQLAANTGLASVTSSLNAFTASQDSRNFVISQFTSSTNNSIVGVSAFTSSQLAVNLGNAIYTSSVDNHIVGISAFTSSQLAVNFGISLVTASLIGITNTLMGFTASLDNTYATDAQLYQLYQATRSIELHSGSMVGITNGLMAYTSSNETWKTGIRGEISGIEAWTASLDNTYATDAQLYELYATTASLNTTTGSIKGELAGLESYTASLKAAAIVSSSTQISNYYKFAETASANIFYGNQTISGSLLTNGNTFISGNLTISGSINSVKYVDFPQWDSATQPGRLSYDTGEGTLTFGLSGGNLDLPIGVINFETCFNEDSSSISKGDAVRVTGAQGNRVAVKKAHALDDDGSAEILGLAAETIGVGAEGKIITSGPLKGVNTSAYTEGQKVYLSTTPGAITVEKPQAPVHNVWLGVIQRVHASVGIISIKVQNGYEIEELHDVRITTASLVDKQLLARSGSVWANQTISHLGIAETASVNPIMAYTASLKNAFTIDGNNDVYFVGKITTQELHTTYTTSSVLFQSGSTKFGNTPDDRHEFTGSLLVSHSFEVIESSTGATKGDFFVDSPNKYVYVGRQSATSGDNTTFVVRDRTNTSRATIPGGGSTDTIFSTNASNFRITNYSGTNLLNVSNVGNITGSGNLLIQNNSQLGASNTSKHEITGSLNTSFGGSGGLFVNDGFQKTFTFATGNLFSIDFGTAEGGGFVDVTYGGVVTTIGGRGGATRYAISYKDATNAVATKVHGYGDDIVSASISATKVAIFSIAGDAVQSAKYQVNVSVNAVAADGSGNYDKILYNRL